MINLDNVTLFHPNDYQIINDVVVIDNELILRLAATIRPKCKSIYYSIIKAICNYYDVETEQVINGNKKSRTSKARMLCCYCLYTHKTFNLSLPEVAEIMKKDHTSIHYAVNKIKKNMKEYEPILKKLNLLKITGA